MKRISVSVMSAAILLALTLSGCGTAVADGGSTEDDNEEKGETVEENEENEGDGENDASDGETSGTEKRYDYDLEDYLTLGGTENFPERDEVLAEMISQYREASKADAESVTYDADGVGGAITQTDGVKVEDGDVVNIDYVGKIDGVAFSGGTDTGYDLTIGSGAFIPGFESGLIGAAVEETVDVNVRFPDDYHAELAGKNAVFTVTVNSVTRYSYPEYNEENVKKYIGYSVSEFEKRIAGTLIFNALYVSSTVIRYPESELELIRESYVESVKSAADYYGIAFETYLAYMGYSEESFGRYVNTLAEQYVKRDMLIYLLLSENPQLKMTDGEYETESKSLWESMVENGEYSDSYENFCLQNDRFDIETGIYMERLIVYLGETALPDTE